MASDLYTHTSLGMESEVCVHTKTESHIKEVIGFPSQQVH
jgi:hypothetical protein